jgi:hypothetical protein
MRFDYSLGKRRRIAMKAITTVLIISVALAWSAGIAGAENQYNKFEFGKGETVRARLIITPEQWTFIAYENGRENIYRVPSSDVVYREGAIRVGSEIMITDKGLQFPEYFIPGDEIYAIRISPGQTADETDLSFVSEDTTAYRSQFRRKTSDRVSLHGPITVAADEFVRGSVISYFGDVTVYGEVNEDVLSVFGDVTIGPEAVVRGDVIAVNGRVKLESGASVYGIIKSEGGKTATRRHRARKWKEYYKNKVGLSGAFYYNRVDGATLWGGIDYQNADSVIPSFEAMGGYGFSSGRWRYRLGLTQTLLRGRVPVQVGGRIFRELKSEDDLLISEAENTIFALLFNEDWKDYYEAQGGYGFARVQVLGWNDFEIGFLSEEQHWLDAHPKLWSVFGAKEFRGNFSSVPYDTLVNRIANFNGKQINSLKMSYRIRKLDDDQRPTEGWYGFAEYEYSPKRWRGDFDFERFETRIKRFQPLGKYVSVYLTGAYGYVSGDYIPLSRLFYLGGLGTIYGYRHKEFIGKGYALASGEYRFRLPNSDIAPFLQYDGGKITRDRITGEDTWYSAISVGIDISRSFRIFVSKRLDDADANPIIYARFSAVAL